MTLLALMAALALAQEVPPRVVERAVPEFPAEAQQAGIDGPVTVQIDVDATGTITAVTVLSSPHSLLTLAAERAAWQLDVAPATIDGAAVDGILEYTFRFELMPSDADGPVASSTLHGVFLDEQGLGLAQVTVTMTDQASGVEHRFQTRDDGTFHANFLPAGSYIVRLDHPEYGLDMFEVDLEAGSVLKHTFEVFAASDDEIVVNGVRQWRDVQRGALEASESTTPGTYTLTRRDIEATPGALEDVNRAVHALPGVVSDSDMLATFNARGGSVTDVVYTLDGVPLNNPFHLAGFNSVFNPDMIQSVEFSAGAAPAHQPAGVSAVMAVDSWDGTPRQGAGNLDGSIDLSASSARVFLMGAVTPDERLTFAVAARRSYIESYFAVLKAVNVIDSAFAAPEYSELSGRIAWRVSDRHRLLLTALRSGDSLALVDSDDDSLVNFEGAFELSNNLSLVSLKHVYSTGERLEWSSVAAVVGDRSYLFQDLGASRSQEITSTRYFGRSDLRAEHGPFTFRTGVFASALVARAEGTVDDPAGLPAFYNGPIADHDVDQIELAESVPLPEVAVYAQEEWDGPVRLRAGVRATWAGLSDEILLSPRAGLSVPLPTGTIPKVAWGIYQQSPIDPRLLSPTTGNPDLKSETAHHLVVGVDQALPLPTEGDVGLLRVEGYYIDLDNVVVHADTDDGGPVFDNSGTGRSYGLDTMTMVKKGRFRGSVNWSVLWTERTNPRNTLLETTVSPVQDQRHTLGSSLEFAISPRWRGTIRYNFHTGRPVSRVAPTAAGLVTPTCINCDQLGNFHQFDTRVEWRKAFRHHRLSFYAELLNVTNFASDFVPIVEVEEDGSTTESMFSHLPLRPFIGTRSDF